MLYTKVRFFVTNTLLLCEKSEKYFIVFLFPFLLKISFIYREKGERLDVICFLFF